jgi:hypothetical protein
MVKRPFKKPLLKVVCTGAVVVGLLTGCLPLIATGPEEDFSMNWAGASDTVSPYGPLSVYFTSPVLFPDSVIFDIMPIFSDYRQQGNESADTFSLELLRSLRGGSRYVLRLAEWVESIDGSFLTPGNDSIVFHTWPAEQEPNNGRTTADTLGSITFGSISMANDTDWFEVRDSTVETFYIKSIGSSSLFDIRDAAGAVRGPTSFAAAETLSVPQGFVRPLHLVVYAFNRSNGGHYELGSVNR